MGGMIGRCSIGFFCVSRLCDGPQVLRLTPIGIMIEQYFSSAALNVISSRSALASTTVIKVYCTDDTLRVMA